MTSIQEPDMDPWAKLVDGPRAEWPAAEFRRRQVEASHPVPVFRHRRRATFKGFVSNPMVVGASVAIIISCGIAAGLIIARFVGVS